MKQSLEELRNLVNALANKLSVSIYLDRNYTTFTRNLDIVLYKGISNQLP